MSEKNEPIDDNGLDLEKETVINFGKEEKVDQTFSPIHEPRTDRDYAKGEEINNVPTGENLNIPEPDFRPEPVSFGEEGDDVDFEDIPKGKDSPKKTKHVPDDYSYNTKMENLSKKEKKEAAEIAANAVVDFYLEYKPKLFRYIGRVPQKKVDKLVRDGKLDMRMPIDFGDEIGVHTMQEVVEKINSDVEGTFVPETDFKERVVPALTRIFIKKDIGLTDEQYVLIEFGKDLVSSVAELIQIKNYTKSLLEYASDISLQKQQWIREQEMSRNVTPQPAPEPPKPSHEPPKPEAKNTKSKDDAIEVQVVETVVTETIKEPEPEMKNEMETQIDEGDIKIQE